MSLVLDNKYIIASKLPYFSLPIRLISTQFSLPIQLILSNFWLNFAPKSFRIRPTMVESCTDRATNPVCVNLKKGKLAEMEQPILLSILCCITSQLLTIQSVQGSARRPPSSHNRLLFCTRFANCID